jgi:hypothetical protein
MLKVDPRAEKGVRILIKESDRDVSSLEKSSTNISPLVRRGSKMNERVTK